VLVLCLLWVGPPTGGQIASAFDDARTGLDNGVTFTDYSDLSSSTELIRRLLSPFNAARIMDAARQPGSSLRDQPIDLTKESFALYVPPHRPANGYSLLVFVPPWPRAEVPSRFIAALQGHGMIFVSPANAGNDANVLDRREPLALLAARNVMNRYPVDPQRIYIGGLSGGSRVALRLALGYPDLFHGALLNAGSDPIGNTLLPLPAPELFRQFQEVTRIVYLTGERDEEHLASDAHSRASLQEWCVLNWTVKIEPRNGHELADPVAFSDSLDWLERKPDDPGKIAGCRARLEKGLGARLEEVEAALARGDRKSAARLLVRLDEHYGGLAAPRSLALLRSATTE
jgi:pimeloyl-ACP methyl ester carboxylesterase